MVQFPYDRGTICAGPELPQVQSHIARIFSDREARAGINIIIILPHSVLS